MPKGGQIVVETKNVRIDEFFCKSHPVSCSHSSVQRFSGASILIAAACAQVFPSTWRLAQNCIATSNAALQSKSSQAI